MQINSKREMRHFNFFSTSINKLTKRKSKNDGAPLVSVVTVCNEKSNSEFILEMLKSLQNQTFPYWEWIIVTNTKKVFLDNKLLKNNQIKLIKSKYNSVQDAKLTGIKESSTDLIFYFEENDLIDKTLLECGYFSMLLNKEADFAYSYTVEFGKKID
ncbi:glycosyltransferase family A protein [Candidatus Ruminimicrobium bovinum]|uniref:glycosyltransferase family A protein n=1 Tax=Candidatus Ruminimicrobium bovinum TaxID=3242779 RepID=UPI0039B8A53D